MGKKIAMNEIEMTRASFKPEPIKMLFVGESAPVSGKFFYYGNSNMHRYMAQAFDEAFGPHEHFLDSLKARGCYLDDLVLAPVNGLSRAERTRACVESKDDLARQIKEYSPRVVVCLMKGIEPIVSQAARDAGIEQFHCTHFPGNGRQGKFAEDMRLMLNEYQTLLMPGLGS
jgi:hypothetical protein